MCSRKDCKNCGKASWAGCGLHIKSALAGVKEEDRCPNWKKGARWPCGADSGAAEDGDAQKETAASRGGIMGFFGR